MTNDSTRTLRVTLKQQRDAVVETHKADLLTSRLDVEIRAAERLLARNGRMERVGVGPTPGFILEQPVLLPWDQLVADAEAALPDEASFTDLLSPSELEKVLERLTDWDAAFSAEHRLRPRDYAIAGAAGVLAGLIDVLLVKVPRHARALGGTVVEGGWLSNAVKDGFSHLLPPETIRSLEKAYKVPYDFSTNRELSVFVKGLGPCTHRLQSLGHDPLLGWIFGVRDILAGGFTSIGSDGAWTFQKVAGADLSGLPDLGTRVIEAFLAVGGHMVSDVATAAGLNPPMFGLLQLVHSGNIRGRSISDLSRLMYANGYDFRHFLAGSAGTFLIDVIVRFSWTAGELLDGRTFEDSLPIGRQPRLQTSLLLANSVATAVNAGKVAITQNPLALNWAQWLAFFRYLVPQVHWCLVGKELARERYLAERIETDLVELQAQLNETWRSAFTVNSIATI